MRTNKNNAELYWKICFTVCFALLALMLLQPNFSVGVAAVVAAILGVGFRLESVIVENGTCGAESESGGSETDSVKK